MILSMNFDIVIVGGGLVGASMAAALRDSGLTLVMVESQVPPSLNQPHTAEWDSRMYAISPGSRHFLEGLAAWNLLDHSRIAPVEAMRVFGDSGAELDFSAYQMGVTELACIVENRALLQALWQTLPHQENLTVLQPARCAALAVSDRGAALTLADGRMLSAKLIIGADGGDSWVRKQSGIHATAVDYEQCGVVANFSCEYAHRGIAHQWFQQDGILALLPLPGKRVSMVWSVNPQRSAQLLALSAEELGAQVSAAAQQRLGQLQLITAPAAFPLQLLVLPKITAPRLALVGDAAHQIHPLAGQGVNTGFRDVAQLAQILKQRGAQNDSGDALLLRQYERKRKADLYMIQTTTHGLKHLFNNDLPLLRTLRNAGLAATNSITPLKKLLVQHALH